ncbi:hypothetical protein BH10PSE7_BH10PSE7_42340 [soil metagenome]
MHLSSELGIARSTLRTALIELEKDDLVERTPYSSWAVPNLTPQTVWEVYTLRAAFEGMAARLVASNLTQAARDDLLDAFAGLEEAESSSAGSDRIEAALRFHTTIVEHSGHHRLIRQYRILRDKIEWIYRWSEDRWPQRVSLPAWHRPVLDAILSRAPEAAETAIRLIAETSLDNDLATLEPEDA